MVSHSQTASSCIIKKKSAKTRTNDHILTVKGNGTLRYCSVAVCGQYGHIANSVAVFGQYGHIANSVAVCGQYGHIANSVAVYGQYGHRTHC